MPTPTKFWDKAAQRYAASPIKDVAAYEHTMERVRSYLNADTRVLEIGCGTGSTALLLAPDLGQITGTDISPEMVRIARGKISGEQHVAFEVKTALEAAQGAADSDVVLGFNIFHLTPDMSQIFSTLHDQMAPGAFFISKTPCLAEPSIGIKRFAFAAMVPIMRLFRVAPFVGMFSFARLESAIEDAGFDIVEMGSFPVMSRFVVARRRG